MLPAFTQRQREYPFFHLFVAEEWPKPHRPRILPGRAPFLCNLDTQQQQKKINKNNMQTQAPKPHTYRAPGAEGGIMSAFKQGISSSHFQIIHWDAKVI